MKKTISAFLAALMMVVVLVGCGGNGGNSGNGDNGGNGGNTSDVVGTWGVESVAAAGLEYTVDEFRELAGDTLGDMLDMTFEFSADGTMKLTATVANGEGTWTEEGDTVSIDDGDTIIEMTKKDGKLIFEQSGTTFTLAKK